MEDPILPVEIKAEPEEQEVLNSQLNQDDLFLEDDKTKVLAGVIPQFPSSDPHVDDVHFFTDIEISNTAKCLDNVRILIKDFETQMDWHLKQYMVMRNFIKPKHLRNNNDPSNGDQQDDDLISITQLSQILMTHPDCNHKFLRSRQPMMNGTSRRRKDKNNEDDPDDPDDMSMGDDDDDEEDYESGEEDGYYEDAADEEKYGKNNMEEYQDEEDEIEEDEGGEGGKKKRGGRKKVKTEPADDIDEEFNELPVVKEEFDDDSMGSSSMSSFIEPPVVAKGKKGKAPAAKKTPAKTPAKKGGRGKKRNVDEDDDDEEFVPAPKKAPTPRKPRGKKAAPSATITSEDQASMKTCSIVLERVDADAFDDEDDAPIVPAVKKEEVDSDLEELPAGVLQSEKDRLNEVFKPLLINALEDFKKALAPTVKKPILVLKEDSLKSFDVNTDTKKNNVVVTFKTINDLPDFVYDHINIVNAIKAGTIKVVQADVFIQHMTAN